MPIKGLFNSNSKKGDPVRGSDELDKQILRINSLEVQIKKLLDSEKQLRTSMYGAVNGGKGEPGTSEQKTKTGFPPRQKGHSPDGRENWSELQKLKELTNRMDKLERIVQRLLDESITRTVPQEKESIKEEQLQRLVERIVSEQLAGPYKMHHEAQAGLIKRMDEHLETHNDILKKLGEDMALREERSFRTLYIDKFYLDKYEQNNNFAQIGIRELSGALNIGATYGKDVIPKKITEEVKEEIEKMKAAFPQKGEQPESNEPAEPHPESSDSDFTSIPLEEDDSD